jgi:RimJ/RimL family protein N-acetyltransferase
MNLIARRTSIRSLPREFQSADGVMYRISPVVGELQPRLVEMYVACREAASHARRSLSDAQCGKWVRDVTHSGVNIVAVAPNGAVVGHVGILPSDERHCELTLTVRPAFQNQGIGRELTEAAVVAAAESGFEQIRLVVEPGNEVARRVFERAGFRASDGQSASEDAPIRMEMDVLPLVPAAAPMRTSVVAMPHFLQFAAKSTAIV